MENPSTTNRIRCQCLDFSHHCLWILAKLCKNTVSGSQCLCVCVFFFFMKEWIQNICVCTSSSYLTELLWDLKENAIYKWQKKYTNVKYLKVVMSNPFKVLSVIFRKYLGSRVSYLMSLICFICVPLPAPYFHSCLCGLKYLSYLFYDLFWALSEFRATKAHWQHHYGSVYWMQDVVWS